MKKGNWMILLLLATAIFWPGVSVTASQRDTNQTIHVSGVIGQPAKAPSQAGENHRPPKQGTGETAYTEVKPIGNLPHTGLVFSLTLFICGLMAVIVALMMMHHRGYYHIKQLLSLIK